MSESGNMWAREAWLLLSESEGNLTAHYFAISLKDLLDLRLCVSFIPLFPAIKKHSEFTVSKSLRAKRHE